MAFRPRGNWSTSTLISISTPHELQLEITAERGSQYPCPHCQHMCPAHDFKEKTWRHLNFFKHHCFITARVPRVKCPEHGIRLVNVPYARKGSGFTMLFKQAALTLVREIPVRAAARIVGITDKRLWRIVYVEEPKIINLNPFIRASLAHYYFCTIHPFWDGNGRTGRLIEAIHLQSANVKFIARKMSNYYCNVNDYYNAFSKSIKLQKDASPWWETEAFSHQ